MRIFTIKQTVEPMYGAKQDGWKPVISYLEKLEDFDDPHWTQDLNSALQLEERAANELKKKRFTNHSRWTYEVVELEVVEKCSPVLPDHG